MKRKDDILLVVYVVLLVAVIAQGQWAGAADETHLQTDSGTRLTGLLHNEDCTDFFYTQTFPPGKAGEIADRYVDVIAGAGVTVLFCNTNARRTNYRSDVWEAFWDGYDPDGPDDQPFLVPIPETNRKQFRNLIHNMLEVHRQGVDYPARIVQRCRHHGISPWISLRMNDVHSNDNLAHPFHGDLWRKPELFRQGHPDLFNHFQNAGWPLADYQRRLKAFSSLAELCKLPRRHVVTHREVVVPGEDYRAPLPVTGRELSFYLPLGPTPAADWRAEAIIEVAPQNGNSDAPCVSVNDVATELDIGETLQNGNRLLTYSIPTKGLPGKNSDTIQVTAAGERPIRLFGVEVKIFPAPGPE